MTQRRRATREQSQSTPKILIPEHATEFYANAIQVIFSAWDFTLLFGSTVLPSMISGQSLSQGLAGDIRIDAVVRMSPQHAKAMLRLMEKLVSEYEQQLGEIRIPPEVQDENPKSS